MLKNLKIQNFRGLSDLSLEGLGRFNVLLGANNIGKTSVLEAVHMLPGMGGSGFTSVTQFVRGFTTRSTQDSIYYFHALDVELEINISSHTILGGTRAFRMFSAHKAEDRIFASSGQGDSLSSSGPNLRELHCELQIKPPGGQSASIGANIVIDDKGEMQPRGDIEGDLPNFEKGGQIEPITPIYSHPRFRQNTWALKSVTRKNREPHLLKAIQRIEPQIIGFADDNAGVILLNTGLSEKIPINMFGDGMASIFGILSLVYAGDSKIVLIDQIEDGLHFKAVRTLLKALIAASRDDNIQFFITTHDLEVLQAIREITESDQFSDFQPEIRCYYLGRDKEGAIRSYRYDYEQFEHCIGSAIEIR